MTTGKPTRLGEKLNADLVQLRQEHLDLTASQLSTFRTDLLRIVSDAEDTISTDFRWLQSRIRTISQANTIWAEKMFRISPLMASVCILLIILALMMFTIFWQWTMTSMQLSEQLKALGLETVMLNDKTYLLLNPKLTNAIQCTVDGKPVICIQMGE